MEETGNNSDCLDQVAKVLIKNLPYGSWEVIIIIIQLWFFTLLVVIDLV